MSCITARASRFRVVAATAALSASGSRTQKSPHRISRSCAPVEVQCWEHATIAALGQAPPAVSLAMKQFSDRRYGSSTRQQLHPVTPATDGDLQPAGDALAVLADVVEPRGLPVVDELARRRHARVVGHVGHGVRVLECGGRMRVLDVVRDPRERRALQGARHRALDAPPRHRGQDRLARHARAPQDLRDAHRRRRRRCGGGGFPPPSQESADGQPVHRPAGRWPNLYCWKQ